MAEYNCWTTGNKTAYLIATLNKPAAQILHSVSSGMRYPEVTVAFENRYGDHHLITALHVELRKKPP
jgi:hypothetical protein